MQVLVAVTFDNAMVIATGMFASFLVCKYTQIISLAIKYHKINAEKIVLQIFLAIGNATFVLELCSRVSAGVFGAYVAGYVRHALESKCKLTLKCRHATTVRHEENTAFL